MKYLGLDYGTKKVGTALSDEGGTIAFPRATLPNDENLLLKIKGLVEVEGAGAIVVGDTRAASGAPNQATDAAESFIEALRRLVEVPVERGFEAWSSVEASRYAPKGRARDDAAAAAIILQRFLDMRAGK